MTTKIKEFIRLHEHKIILFLGFILVAVLSFEAGMMKGAKISQKPIIIEKTAQLEKNTLPEASGAPNLPQDGPKNEPSSDTMPQNCAYLGSKNSNKYHLPTCRWAKNIKPENRVCFSSEDEAKLKGYQPDKNCIK